MPNTPGPIKSGKSFPARTTESNSNLQGPYDHAVLLAIKLKNAVSTSCSLSSKYCYSCCSYHIRAQKRRHNVKVFLVSSKRVGCCDNSGCSKTTQLIYSFPVADSQEQSHKLQEHNSMLRRSESIAALTRGPKTAGNSRTSHFEARSCLAVEFLPHYSHVSIRSKHIRIGSNATQPSNIYSLRNCGHSLINITALLIQAQV